ncbi:MAG: aldehyde reductase [Gammaproteobacteria bacterium]|nr:aldehyde reductase [Gammaproteobacteria bacterium]|tara:strand:+ start:1635 stop:2642 length:1008 start_codon:yes stop_codon:yes gene_type:complete
MEKVLVTGATGYIGLHCIDQLLKQGYAVNGSVRSPERKDEVYESLNKNNTPTDNLNIFTFNLTDDEGWDEGINGCDYVLHVASPISLDSQEEEYFVGPAVAGVERALKFAKKHQVKKVVLTSSVAAIFETTVLKKYYDESDWSDPSKPEINHYAKSKTLAEMAAWDFVKNEGNPFELAVINPALVIGPTLSDDLGESNKAISLLVTGKMPITVPLQFGYVDVRDVASAHILAMQNPASNGERFALSEKDLWYEDVAKLLRANGFNKAPKINLPKWAAKFLAPFSSEIKFALPTIGRVRSVKNTTKAKDILGWEPRSAEESILEIAEQIKAMDLIK